MEVYKGKEYYKKLNLSGQLHLSEDQKHTSAVVKLHHQKLISENIVLKSTGWMNRLQETVFQSFKQLFSNLDVNIEH